MTKAVIYARLNTIEQEPGNRLQVLTGWALNRGFHVVEVYQEAESAWKNRLQSQLKQPIADDRHYRFEVAMVWALD